MGLDDIVYLTDRKELIDTINSLKHQVTKLNGALELHAIELDNSKKRESGYRKIIAALCFKWCGMPSLSEINVSISTRVLHAVDDTLEIEDLVHIDGIMITARMK